VPGTLFQLGSSAICPHGGQVSVVTSNTRVLLNGQPVATMKDTFPVAGCTFSVPGPKPQPCVRVQWIAAATRVLVMGSPPITLTATGLALSVEGIPGGPPTVIRTQLKVSAI
jgi:uncharacterized Zn-binding protein involved in type VI secretion